jgi:hypothetical protein
VRVIAAVAVILAVILAVAACSEVPGDPGWAHHPGECGMGIVHADCLPGTAGYNNSPEVRAANDDAQCQSYGAAPGSQAYIQCRMNIDNQRAQMRAAVAGALAGHMMTPAPAPPSTVNVNLCNVPGQVNTCMYPR